MELLKSFKQHGCEIKIYRYFENTMRVVARNPEGESVSITCPFNEALDEAEEVKKFLAEYFMREAIID